MKKRKDLYRKKRREKRKIAIILTDPEFERLMELIHRDYLLYGDR